MAIHSLNKADRILNRSKNITVKDCILETCEYNPKKDKIAVFVGSENEIPPKDIIEEITDVLDKLPECKLLVAPGIFRFVILKGEKK